MAPVVDVLGLGFGPANLSLAIALEESGSDLSACFLEAQGDPTWQGGMMLNGSNIQNHPCRDLVSLRNPRSRYTFLNYLFENNRLIEHLNLPGEFPLRKEYAHYIRWVAGHFSHVAKYGARVARVQLVQRGGEQLYEAVTQDGRTFLGRILVLGTGRTPHIPPPFDSVDSPRVFHLTRYLYRIGALDPAGGEKFAVIGGSQSAVELTLDLAKRFPRSTVTMYVRSPGLRLKDTSPFSEEGFFPEFTDYYYRADRHSKHILDSFMRTTNYSSADQDVLHELYLMMYEQRLDDDQRVFVAGNRGVHAVTVTDEGVELAVTELHTGVSEIAHADAVVLATGFKDLGPGDRQEPFPAVLSSVIDRFRFDELGYIGVRQDYRLDQKDPSTPDIFLNGLCEASHGIGDAGSFSLLSLRANTICNSLCACVRSRLPAFSTSTRLGPSRGCCQEVS